MDFISSKQEDTLFHLIVQLINRWGFYLAEIKTFIHIRKKSIHSYNFRNCFILFGVKVDPEPIPEKWGTKQEHTLNGPLQGSTQEHTPTHT